MDACGRKDLVNEIQMDAKDLLGFGVFIVLCKPSADVEQQSAGAKLDRRQLRRNETKMRRILMTVSTAVALIAGPFVLASNRAEAMITAPQFENAEQSINPIEKTACWRSGWRDWGWYPCGYCGNPATPLIWSWYNRPAVVLRVRLH